jgi:hypothetical protein
MSRAVVSTLQLAGLLASLVACDVGEIPIGGGGGSGGPDGNTAALCADRGQIGVAHQHAGGGATHAGEGCIAVGCHLAGTVGVPAFTAAGTVYKADGTTPNGGAAVRVVTGGTTLKGFADDAGNFFITGPITFPAQTNASACPDTTPMAGAIAQGGGNCNGGAACHQAGGTQGVIKFQ